MSIPISSILYIRGQGTGLAGTIDDGEIAIGEKVALVGPVSVVEATVHGIEVERQIVPTASSGQEVGLWFKKVEPSSLADGVTRNDNGTYSVFSLVVTQRVKSWWRIW